jgi:hypothetical protein
MREMSRNFLTIIVLIFVNCISVFSQSNAWNGIVPLHSTRSQVAKILGTPKEKTVFDAFKYESKDGQVEIYYSDKKCDAAWDIPMDTVLSLKVYPVSLAGKSLDELKIDKNNFSVSIDDAFYAKWTNAEEGLQYYFYQIDKELISIYYLPKKSDNNLRCNGFPPFAPEGQHYTSWVSPFYKKNLSKGENFNEVIARFQNILVELGNLEKEKYNAYVVVYFDDKLPFREYERYLTRIKQYVLKTWKVPSKALTVIEGGMREDSQIEFYILPQEWKPPAPNPTLPSPQFIKKQ